MSNNELQVLSDIRERVVRVETKLDSMTGAKDTANEALQYGKSAHHRLDEVADNQRWLWRTVVGALILGAISLLWKGMAV
ncbi:hemolysin XhlA [Brevibacillus formosus]|uniref:Hemolysin XhlA n=1 Tax=Brevibacillus formosus TaxID=54913 RepID=A0A220MKQ0_9BACL|nr:MULTISPECIES: hemolysin XhlA family protein [Brevibacillus]ASJ55543.1 hemolysin XhlA [Brevibacillus formosus]MBY0088407.1 hemolysin XhlA family protein [Brevibacillus brevis]